METFFYKNIILLFLLFILVQNSHSQIIDSIAIENVIKADSLFDNKDYNNAIKFYHLTNERYFFPKNQIYEMIALSYYFENQKDSALNYIIKSIKAGKHYWTESSLSRDYNVLQILSFDSSGVFFGQLKDNTAKFLDSKNYLSYKLFSDSLVTLKKLDQKYRTIKGKKSETEWKKQKVIDFENQKFLSMIIDSINKWPGYREVGREGESAAYLIVQHSEDSIFQKKCLPLLHKELLVNNINPSHYGLLVDRYLLITKNYQLFGTQVEFIKEAKITLPKRNELLNVKYMQTLRSYFNMPPLSFYLNQMNEMNLQNNKHEN